MVALKLAVPALVLAACSCQDESQAAFTSSCEWTFPEDGEARDRLWPIGSGIAPCTLLTTYGQAVGSSANKLHLGLDSPRQAKIALAAFGPDGVIWDSDEQITGSAGENWLNSRGISIAGGTNEMQRNIVSERLLGLPREPSFDRGVPFNEVLRNRSKLRS